MSNSEINGHNEDVADVSDASTSETDESESNPSVSFAERLAEYSDRIVLGAHKAQEKVVDYSQRVAEKAGAAREKIAGFGEQAFSEARYMGGEVGAKARANPLLLVGVALAAGALIARIGRR